MSVHFLREFTNDNVQIAVFVFRANLTKISELVFQLGSSRLTLPLWGVQVVAVKGGGGDVVLVIRMIDSLDRAAQLEGWRRHDRPEVVPRRCGSL